MEGNILQVEHLNTYYLEQQNQKSALLHKRSKIQILKDISFEVKAGEVVGIVGESGCGKTTLAKTVLGFVKDYEGNILLNDKHPQMVFQDPHGSLNPAKTVGWLLEEPLKNLTNLSEAQRKEKALWMLKQVGLDEKYAEHYPRQLSGGQRQRVAIAIALILSPKLLIADEPVSALDVTIQTQILELLRNLKEEFQLSMLFISHDLRVVYHMCDRILIMKQGEIVESGKTQDVYQNPQHAYTRQLLQAAGIRQRMRYYNAET